VDVFSARRGGSRRLSAILMLTASAGTTPGWGSKTVETISHQVFRDFSFLSITSRVFALAPAVTVMTLPCHFFFSAASSPRRTPWWALQRRPSVVLPSCLTHLLLTPSRSSLGATKCEHGRTPNGALRPSL